MNIFFAVIYALVALVVIMLILFQGRGAGLGSAWGGAGETFATRRGVEKFTFMLTFIVITVFFVLSLVNLFIK